MTQNKDWTGNSNSIFKTLGASSHTGADRQREDYYATSPVAAEHLLKLETFTGPIWECACGEGHLSKVFEKAGYQVRSSDLINRGFGEHGIDFLAIDNQEWNGAIISNPPYREATQFIKKALDIIPEGQKVAMFLKLQFMEGKGRKPIFINTPPHTIYVSSSRLLCAKNGDFEKGKKELGAGAVAYAWYVWQKGFKGTTSLKWFN